MVHKALETSDIRLKKKRKIVGNKDKDSSSYTKLTEQQGKCDTKSDNNTKEVIDINHNNNILQNYIGNNNKSLTHSLMVNSINNKIGELGNFFNL